MMRERRGRGGVARASRVAWWFGEWVREIKTTLIPKVQCCEKRRYAVLATPAALGRGGEVNVQQKGRRDNNAQRRGHDERKGGEVGVQW